MRAITTLFFLFVAVNLSAIYSGYHLLSIALEELRSKVTYSTSPSFINEFSTSGGLGVIGAVVIHLATDFFIYTLIRKVIYLADKKIN
jgi:hypothetical protein